MSRSPDILLLKSSVFSRPDYCLYNEEDDSIFPLKIRELYFASTDKDTPRDVSRMGMESCSLDSRIIDRHSHSNGNAATYANDKVSIEDVI